MDEAIIKKLYQLYGIETPPRRYHADEHQLAREQFSGHYPHPARPGSKNQFPEHELSRRYYSLCVRRRRHEYQCCLLPILRLTNRLRLLREIKCRQISVRRCFTGSAKARLNAGAGFSIENNGIISYTAYSWPPCDSAHATCHIFYECAGERRWC